MIRLYLAIAAGFLYLCASQPAEAASDPDFFRKISQPIIFESARLVDRGGTIHVEMVQRRGDETWSYLIDRVNTWFFPQEQEFETPDAELLIIPPHHEVHAGVVGSNLQLRVPDDQVAFVSGLLAERDRLRVYTFAQQLVYAVLAAAVASSHRSN